MNEVKIKIKVESEEAIEKLDAIIEKLEQTNSLYSTIFNQKKLLHKTK
jgi:hypothetical protein